jgi:2-dehydro-3-deoxyphosphogluconate aldolase/(4S)-4-hydroxy-2-oxoglutarate aldolase
MNKTLEQIGLLGIVPVIAIEKAEHAEPLAQALADGGLPVAEVTFRTAAARDAIARIASRFPNMLLGAGTVLTIDQVKAARDAGAKFIVAPGLNRNVVEYCVSQDIPVTPGVSTPSDVEAALELGLDVVKFFPAEAAGGLAFLKALAGPYGKVKYIPTGGIDESNLLAYLRFPKTLACGGSWMVKAEMINTGKFGEIKALTSRAVSLMLGFDLQGLSIGGGSDVGKILGTLLNVPVTEEGGVVRVGSRFHLSGEKSAGTTILLKTNFLERASAFLAARGYKIQPVSDPLKGNSHSAYAIRVESPGVQITVCQA